MAEADLSSRRASRLRRLTACRQANSSVKIGSGRESFKKVQLAFRFGFFSHHNNILCCNVCLPIMIVASDMTQLVELFAHHAHLELTHLVLR